MTAFPAVDPIPLPAPVWLMKLLHIVTMSLHFVAVEMLLGGLLVAVALSLLSRSNDARAAAGGIARRLPIVMTYVINLGVPPLLFAQVLYGRALYTSTVLIGAWWIAVIPLLMACYWLLYRFSARLEPEPGQPPRGAWWLGAMALIIAAAIAKIYSSNMTLMLRPEAWPGMYAAAPNGAGLPTGDPTLIPRWLFMLAGGIGFAGLWMAYLGSKSTFEASAQRFLACWGGRLAALGAVVLAITGWQVVQAQPAAVQSAMGANSLYSISAMAWLAVVALILVFGAITGLTGKASGLLGWGAALLAFLAAATMTLYRDGLRDQTLLWKGYDVWNRTVVTNWGVVILFLLLFVAGLGVVGWLISVVARAKKVMESAA